MMMGGWGGPGYGMMRGGMMAGMGVPMLLGWLVVVAAVVLLARWAGLGCDACRKPKETALEILEKRYARGEVDKAEFESRKKDLVG